MANYKTYCIGDVVELCTETNSDLKYGLESVRGISNTKEIQNTKANLTGRNLAPFHVVRKNEFVYNRRTSRNGERVGLGFNNTDETILITEDYVHFRVKDEKQINPNYLYLFFKRDEFDREARYNSWGSATEFFNWDDMQAIKINIPPIEEQRRIVSEYQTVERRIKNNEAMILKLEETAQAIYHHTFVEGIDDNNLPEGWRISTIKDFCNIFTGKKDVNQSKAEGPYRFFSCSPDYFYSDEYIAEGPAVLISGNGSYTGRVSFYNAKFDLYQRKYACIPKENCEKYIHFVYAVMKYQFERIKMGGTRGTSIPYIVMDDIADFPVFFHEDISSEFDDKMKCILSNIDCLERETSHLRTLLSLLTSKLS